MSIIELTGIRPELPIGAMGAFGVLRVLASSKQVKAPRLGWNDSGDGSHAVLETAGDLGRGDLVSLLIDDVAKAPKRAALTRMDQIKTVEPNAFAAIAKELTDAATCEDYSAAEWVAAFATELVADDGHVEPTPFDMSVARQRFPADAVRLAGGLASQERSRRQKTASQEYEEALFGPWRYEDDQHSLGWDPTTVKLGAFTYKAPTGMANTGVRAAVWLAFESLPLFPVFANGKYQRTRAFIQNRGQSVFCWPVWKTPITIWELKSLLATAALVDNELSSWKDLEARGVTAIYRSSKFKPNKYMVTFRPPELAYSAGRQ